jgi:thiol reductant ABC exporter CydC subunit
MRTFTRLLKLIGPFRWWIVLGVLLSSATSVSSIGLMAVSAYLISKAAVSTTLVDLSLIITGVRFFAISRAALRYAERYINHKATFRILTRLRVWFYTAIEPLAPAGLADRHSGDLLTRIVGDIETLENFYLRVLIPPLAAALVTATACAILGAFDAQLAWVLLAFVLLTGVLLPLASRWLSKRAAQAAVGSRAGLNVALVDAVQGMTDLLAYGQEAAQLGRVAALSRELHRRQEELAVVRGVSAGLATLFTGLAGLAVLGFGIPLVTGGQLDGVFLALLPLTAIAAFEAVQPLAQSLQWLEISQAAAARIFALIDSPPAVQEPASSPQTPIPGRTNAISAESLPPREEFAGGMQTESESLRSRERDRAPVLEIQGLRFRYAPGEPWVFDGLNLCIPAGGSIAIAGPNGSGKSTLVNLLLRFWDYAEGSIRVDGVELREVPADAARALFGVVPQHTYLFNATIRDNLHLADPDATDEELVEACRLAQVHEFILGLPQGYATLVGENGVRLSGGERQRLSIARAILKAAPVLILDEATSQLDPLTEAALLVSLQPFLAGRTTIIISHRRSMLALGENMVELACGGAISSPKMCAPAPPILR